MCDVKRILVTFKILRKHGHFDEENPGRAFGTAVLSIIDLNCSEASLALG